MARIATAIGIGAAILATASPAGAEVLLDRNPIEVKAAYLLPDHADDKAFYYIPRTPRVATWPDGKPKFTFLQYKKVGKDVSGGLVHFLVTFGLTPEERESAERELQRVVPEGRVLGPVPFVQGEFHLISASAGDGGLFSRKIVGTGKAPLLAGQEAREPAEVPVVGGSGMRPSEFATKAMRLSGASAPVVSRTRKTSYPSSTRKSRTASWTF
jgi:hypothetical protein